VGTNPSDYMIAGVFVQGDPKKLIVRGSSVDGVLNPKLTIKSYPDGKVLFENTDWVSGVSASELRTLENGKWKPARESDATLIVTLNPGLYTLEVSPESSPGVGIVEVYEHPLFLGNSTAYNYTPQNYCNVDSTQATEMTEYAKDILYLCENYASSIWNKLYKDTAVPKAIKIFLKRGLKVPGQTVGVIGTTEAGSFIELSAEYLAQRPQEKNVVIHEMVHVAQSYTNVSPLPPSWVIEGMADYVTHTLGFSYDWTHPTCQGGLHYTQGYWCGSAFFSFLEKTYDSALVFKLNMDIKANRYSDSLFDRYTGKNLEKLWQECLQQDCVGGKQPVVKFMSSFKRVEYYKPTGYCSSNMILVWLLFEVTGVNSNDLIYVEEKSIYQTDMTKPYLEAIQATNSEGLVVRGFCAPTNLRSNFQVRLKKKSTGELSDSMIFMVDTNYVQVTQQAPSLNWLPTASQ